VKNLITELKKIGPVLPGTLVTVTRPLKEGTSRRGKGAGVSHMLSYNVKGRNSSLYVKDKDYAVVAEMVANYKRMRDLIFEIGLEMVSVCRQGNFTDAATAWQEQMKALEPKTGEKGGVVQQLRVIGQSRNRWKAKAGTRQKELEKNRISIRDLDASRDKWRAEALAAREAAENSRKTNRRLKQELAIAKKNGQSRTSPKKRLRPHAPPSTRTRC